MLIIHLIYREIVYMRYLFFYATRSLEVSFTVWRKKNHPFFTDIKRGKTVRGDCWRVHEIILHRGYKRVSLSLWGRGCAALCFSQTKAFRVMGLKSERKRERHTHTDRRSRVERESLFVSPPDEWECSSKYVCTPLARPTVYTYTYSHSLWWF